jgi:hypothetical protein
MTKPETVALLDKLILDTRRMTAEEFAQREIEIGFDKRVYNPEDYLESLSDNIPYPLPQNSAGRSGEIGYKPIHEGMGLACNLARAA